MALPPLVSYESTAAAYAAWDAVLAGVSERMTVVAAKRVCLARSERASSLSVAGGRLV